MITSLLTVQCLLWVVPCMARPYLDQADFPLGKYLFDDQVRDGDSHIFPQYQLVQIISRNPAILLDLENQLKKASGENEREDQVWIETDEDPGKYPEFIKKDQESILYPDASFFEEYPVISFRKTPVLHTARTETTSDKAGKKFYLKPNHPALTSLKEWISESRPELGK